MKKLAVLVGSAVLFCCSCSTIEHKCGLAHGSCPGQKTGQCMSKGAATPDCEARLAEIEKRLEYLTSELAIQRGDLDRVREKIDVNSDGAKK